MLDFKDGVFLILGQNGAGKSSLLEAIVFSLYGVGVRYGKRSPLDYVRSGADHCQVKFSFLRGGKKYEVVRRVRTKDRSSEAVLFVNDRILASQRSLVDEKLKEIMGASYESFTSTFFLPQGMVSSLLTATRSKINDIVFDVLFEKKKLAKVIEKVNDAFKDAQRDRDELLRKVNEMKDEIERLDSHIKETPLDLLESEIKNLDRQISSKEEELKSVERDLQMHSQIDSLEKMLRSKVDERKTLLILLEEERKISSAKSLELPYRELLHASESLKKVESNIEKLQVNRSKIQQELQRLEEEIQKANFEASQCDITIQKVQEELERLSRIDEQCEQLVERSSNLKERRTMLEQHLQNRKQDLEKTTRRIQEKKKEHVELERELNSLIEEFERVKSSAVLWMADQIAEELQDGDRCPVCGGTYKKRSVGKFEYDLEKYKQIRETIEKLKEKRAQILTELENLSETDRKLNEEFTAVQQQLRQIELEEGQISQKLNELGYTPQIKKKLREINVQLQKLLMKKSALAADVSKKEATKQQLQLRLKELEEDLKALFEEQKELTSRRQSVENELLLSLTKIGMDFETFKQYVVKDLPAVSAQERLSRIDAEIGQLESQIEQLKGSVKKSREECQRMERSLRQELEVLKNQRDQKINRRAIVKHFMERKEELSKQLEKLQERFEEARKLSSILSMVRETLAAREFQSYVANTVLSEIVEHANHLLDFLTDGRFSLSIDDSGFVVRDGIVKRDANGLSGGEKTLVSIALAMSIAEQATGEMEAFFIDEGFSSLDSDNKLKVADALKRLERLNKVIGFVTHEPEFADYFDRKLIVEKGGKLRWT
uniref:SMC family ATPase n=1 Tax=Pseudothermotoga hypogea TaxID=57487 RepID=A0A832I9U2_9THEM